MFRIVLVIAGLFLAVAPAAAQTTILIDVHSAFLHLDRVDQANGALAIDLGALGLAPGYTIGLESSGDWDAGPGGDTQTLLLGVFSAGTTLLDRALAHRVPGAIDAGIYNFSGGTWPNNEPTDIIEDFAIDRPGITIVIPPGATHLFVTPADIYYLDNDDPDGDLGITITLVSTAVPGLDPDAPGLALAALPNPFTAESSIGLRLADPAAVRLTVHDVTGRLVRTLLAGVLPAGDHRVRWDGRDAAGRTVAAGSYRVRFEGGGTVRGMQVIRLR
jgi:hypothetical protein